MSVFLVECRGQAKHANRKYEGLLRQPAYQRSEIYIASIISLKHTSAMKQVSSNESEVQQATVSVKYQQSNICTTADGIKASKSL
jgi:hypothetical protein